MKPIFINSSPNTQIDDVWLAFWQLLQPWKWRSDDVYDLEKEVEIFFGENIRACAFDSARSSFFQILKAYGVGSGDEVIVPAFTCTVVVNPILWVGAKPVYVDIDKETFNVIPEKIEEKITANTKIILAQHTFGLPLEIERIVKIAKKNNIKVVEDCAHTLGQIYNNHHLGTYADAAIITFGMTKVASGVRGGMAITKDDFLIQKLKNYQSNLPRFPFFKAFKFILNPIIWHLITPVYYLGIGKVTLGRVIIQLLQWLNVISISNIVEPCEEHGTKPVWISRKMSKSLSILASHQLKKIDKLNSHRKKIAKIYAEELEMNFHENSLYLRFPVYVKDKKKVLEYFRKRRIILGDWYKSILHIPENNLGQLFYQKGLCPNAEFAGSHLVNLPTFIKVSEAEARFIAKEIRKFLL